MEAQTAVMENLPLGKPPQQTENKTHQFMIFRRKMSTNQIKIPFSKDKRIRSIIINRSIIL